MISPLRASRSSLALLLLLSILAGCKHLAIEHHRDYVYVVSREVYLRDRVAPVSNKVAPVYNGERLEVVEHGRRFYRVKTPEGAVGWLEEHMVLDQAMYDRFKALHDKELNAPPLATAVLRDDLYAHLSPGRDSERFLLLPENDKLSLLVRASVPKPDAQAAWLRPAKSKAAAIVKRAGKGKKPDEPVDANAVPMEDWWLVRDAAGRVGWVLARRMDIDVPDEVAQYSEGQRIVGAYLLDKVDDPDSSFPGGKAPNYVAVLSPFKDGLPYDYDQIRVFAWNVKKHRYEGAYRKRDVEGYLPVAVKQQVVETAGPLSHTPVPVFTVTLAAEGTKPSLDPQTGMVQQVATEKQSFALEGEMVKRLYAPGEEPAPVKSTSHSGQPEHTARRHKRHRG